MKKIYIYIGIILLTTDCSKPFEQPPAELNGFNFMPMIEGKSILYKQTIVNIDHGGRVRDTTEWILQETMSAQIAQSNISQTYRVEVQRRKLNETQWQAYTVYELQLSKERIVRVDTNTAKVVLTFPQFEGKTWQGNAWNIFENEKFKYTHLNLDTTIQSTNYDSVCEVQHRYSQNAIELKSYKELYRKDIGLLRKEMYDVQSQPNDFPGTWNPDETPILDRITVGIIEIIEILE